MLFRTATLYDLDEMKQLYVDAIMQVCKDDYSFEQREQWCSSVHKTSRWVEVVETQFVLIAEIGRQIVGYGTLKNGTYIDFFYVHKDFQGIGIARQLLERIEKQAIVSGSYALTSDISITAKPFFEKNGFRVLTKQENVIGSEVLINYKMKKQLTF
jgi:putative acetyltransferase